MTPLHRAADALLRECGYGGVDAYVADLRGQGLSWRSIVRALEADTEGAVVVTEVTLRSWVCAAKTAADGPDG